MSQKLLASLQLKGFLSFGPQSVPVQLGNLNVLIGPNGVGKSNFIEAIQLLSATPGDFSGAIRAGGTPAEWIWAGNIHADGAVTADGTASAGGLDAARIEAVLASFNRTPDLRYAIEFADSNGRVEILDELLEDCEKADPRAADVRFLYRFQKGHPAINMAEEVPEQPGWRKYTQRSLKRETIDPRQSILSQRKEAELYPEVTEVGKRFGAIEVFREWSFGRSAPLRRAQPADLPDDVLLPQLGNLGLVLNDLEHRGVWPRLNEVMQRFLPRYRRVSTKVSAGSVQIYLHEEGLSAPVSATRLSDGTLRFLALLAILLNPRPAPLICIEEPELGLHPDAMALIAELLVEASGRTQLVVTTHSDALVSELTAQAESVLVCDYLENGTTLERLESEKLAFWLERYRLGEIWRIGKLGGNLW